MNEKSKIIEVWVPQNERALCEELKPQFAEWKKQGFMPAVFLSGDRELYRQTSDLLCHNRKRLAELETRKEKSLHAAL